MQLLEILSGLTSSELNKFEKMLKESSGKELFLLFKELKSCLREGKYFDAEKSYLKIYGQPYTKDVDYKLRNERRKLKSKIYKFLVDTEFEEATKENNHLYNQYLLKALSKRNIKDLYQSEYISSIDKASSDLDLDRLLQMMRDRSYFLIKGLYINEHNDAELRELYDQIMHYEKKRVIINIRNAEFGCLNLHRAQVARIGTKDSKFEMSKTEEIRFDELDDPWIAYKTNSLDRPKYNIYNDATKYLEYIEYSISLLDQIPNKIPRQHEDYRYEKVEEISVLLHLSQFEKALSKTEELGKYMEENNFELGHGYYEAKTRCYVYLRKVDEAVQTVKEAADVVPPGSEFWFIIIIRVIYGLFLEQRSDEGLRLLREAQQAIGAPKLASHDGLIRYATVIAYIVDKEYEHALRELENFRYSKMMESVPDPDRVAKMINVFRRYIRIKMSPGQGSKSDLQKLIDIINTMNPLLLIYSPVYFWIKLKLEDEISEK